jgi:hypothetical protein
MFKSLLLALFLSIGVGTLSASAAPSPDGKCHFDSECNKGEKCWNETCRKG